MNKTHSPPRISATMSLQKMVLKNIFKALHTVLCSSLISSPSPSSTLLIHQPTTSMCLPATLLVAPEQSRGGTFEVGQVAAGNTESFMQTGSGRNRTAWLSLRQQGGVGTGWRGIKKWEGIGRIDKGLEGEQDGATLAWITHKCDFCTRWSETPASALCIKIKMLCTCWCAHLLRILTHAKKTAEMHKMA